MSTTNLFVELLIIGAGAAGAVVLVLGTIFDVEWPKGRRITNWLSWGGLIPILAVVYVLGIVVDRLANDIVEPWAGKSRDLVTTTLAEEAKMLQGGTWTPHQVRADLELDAGATQNTLEYLRSKARVCRGWTLDCIFLVAALNLFLLVRRPAGLPCVKVALVGTLSLALLGWGTFYTWGMLSETEAMKTATYKAVSDYRSTTNPR